MIMTKIHTSGSETILAACDSELLGKTLEEGDICISVNSTFFGETEVTEDEFRGMLACATSANIVGEKAVNIAIELNCIHPDAVMRILGVPYAMFFNMG